MLVMPLGNDEMRREEDSNIRDVRENCKNQGILLKKDMKMNIGSKRQYD